MAMAFVLAQISDSHLSDSKPFFVENFRVLTAHLAKAKPDLVVNTGDVSLNGADLVSDLNYAHELHEKLGLAWRAIPGNHDIGDNVEISKKQPFNEERRSRWTDVFGADWWVQDAPGWRLLGINSQLLGSGIAADQEQLSFIRNAVGTIGDRALLLFIHKPVCVDHLGEETVSGHNVNPAPRALLLEALGDVEPTIIACGHVHQYREHYVEETLHVWAPATSFFLSRPYQADEGIRTIGFIEYHLHEDGSFETAFTCVGKMVLNDLVDFPEAYGDLATLMKPGADH